MRQKARIIGGPTPEHIGRIGEILLPKEGGNMYPKGKSPDGYHVERIAFPEFWKRPDEMSPEEADDNGWFFEGEYELLD